MPIIAHRINTLRELRALPERIGVEIDVRFDTRTGELYLHHDNQGPGTIEQCPSLDDYLREFRFNQQRVIVFNIKDTGTEERCRELAARYNIPPSHYFLLDVEFPYIFGATRRGIREIAVRFSEAEPIAQATHLRGQVRWVWIDTCTRLPLDTETVMELKDFKTCLVCPERWGRPGDIPLYIARLRELQVTLDAVMTSTKHLAEWEQSGVVKDTI